MNNNSKHRQIKSVGFTWIENAQVLHQPGSPKAVVNAMWTSIPVTKATCSDKTDATGMHTVELSAVCTDTSCLEYMMLVELFDHPGILLLKYTDGSQCIVGDGEFPAMVSIHQADSPLVFNLSCKRTAPTGILYL